MYKIFIHPIFFKYKTESVHHFVFNTLKIVMNTPILKNILSAMYTKKDKRLETEVFGLKFPNQVGLAAGFDKDAKLFDELGQLGFGFIEIGTLTPKGQSGNKQPRLFRITDDEALINRMGFNNQGVKDAVERLKKKKTNVIIGGNIGKNTGIPSEQTDDDYIQVFNELYDYVDYFVVNVSCPNVGNLTELQEKEPLMRLMKKISEINKSKSNPKPLLLKIAPDLSEVELDGVIDIVKTLKLDGLVAANTSVNREGLKTSEIRLEEIGWPGGLSGRPVKDRSTNVISYLYKKLGDDYPIIGVGGIHTGADAKEKLDAGAKLVQVYTGYVYEGPAMIKKINNYLLK